MGAYSVVYISNESGHDAYAQFAVDWSWNVRDRWARSVKEGLGDAWETCPGLPGLDEEAYRALLEHFGLKDWSDEFPVERIISMNPRQLAAARRKKESKYHLERKEMVSDTLGAHVSAEMI